MTSEKQRKFDTAARQIHVTLEDDFGHEHLVQVHVTQDACPMCQRAYPKQQGAVDLDALIEDVKKQLDVDVDRVIAIFEKHGADMSAAKTKRSRNGSS